MARSLVNQLLMIHVDTSFLINALKARSHKTAYCAVGLRRVKLWA